MAPRRKPFWGVFSGETPPPFKILKEGGGGGFWGLEGYFFLGVTQVFYVFLLLPYLFSYLQNHNLIKR